MVLELERPSKDDYKIKLSKVRTLYGSSYNNENDPKLQSFFQYDITIDIMLLKLLLNYF